MKEESGTGSDTEPDVLKGSNMSDKAQLAHTGTVAGAIVVGGVAITGYYLLAIAGGIVLAGALLVRFGFRRGKGVNQS